MGEWFVDNPRHDMQAAIGYVPIFDRPDRMLMLHAAHGIGLLANASNECFWWKEVKDADRQ